MISIVMDLTETSYQWDATTVSDGSYYFFGLIPTWFTSPPLTIGDVIKLESFGIQNTSPTTIDITITATSAPITVTTFGFKVIFLFLSVIILYSVINRKKPAI